MSDPPSGGMFRITLRRPVAILMVTLAAVVFGIFSYRLLPVELMPDISYPSVTVRTEFPGAAPQEVEDQITRPVEEALGVVGGLVRLSSVSRAELSDVTLEFTWDTRMGEAWQEVTERLDSVFLPEEADKPLILRYDPSLDPVLRLALSSTLEDDQNAGGLKRLRTYAEEELKRKLEQVDGVAAVRVVGGLEEQVSVDLSEEALRRTGLSIQEVARRLEVENVNLAGGDIKEGDTQYLVRTVNEFQRLDEIADLVVARMGEREIKLRDVGTVRSGWADREVITRFRGGEAVEIEIQKEADANMVAMAAAVQQALEGKPAEGSSPAEPGLAEELPAGWNLELISDRSTFIRAAVNEVRNAAVIGGLLAVLVLYLFLRDFRATAVISVAIPISVAATFAPMNLSGLTLNIMSLGGLAMGIGMLVDSSIVVVESIARCREEGDGTERAVVRGASEVGTAVVASTLTTVAVFAPMVFVEGVAGQVFGDLALTVVYSLLASLFVALFVVPALAAKLGHAGEGDDGHPAMSPGERIRGVLRYRTLGPLSEAREGFGGRLRSALVALPLLSLAALLLRGTPAIAAVAAVPALLLAALALVFNLAARVTVGGSLPLRVVGALFMLLVDPLLLALETAWLALISVLVVVGGPLAIGLRWTGWLLRLLLIPLQKLNDLLLGFLQRVYPWVVRGALNQRAAVLAGVVAGMALLAAGFWKIDSALIPEVHQGEFDLELTLPVGTPLEQTLEVVRPLEQRALDDPRIDRLVLKVGADPDADAQPEEGEHTARLTVHRAPEPEARGLGKLPALLRRIARSLIWASEGGVVAVREEQVADDLRDALAGLPEVEGKLTRPVLFSFRTPIEVEVEAFELEQLQLLGDSVRAELDRIPGLTDVKSTARAGSPEVQIVYDREALVRLGLDLRAVANIVRAKVRGATATEYRKRERRIDVVVRLTEPDRATLRQLRNLVVNPGDPVPIPLSAIADVTLGTAPADIRRVGQRRVSLVTGNLRGRSLGAVTADIQQRLDALEWPEGTSWSLSGQAQEMERSTRSLWVALSISIFLVYVVMAIQFESILHPLLIMITVPLALLGVLAALFLLQIPLSVVVFLGMIMLAGIVVNNAIVLVDYVNTLRGRGMPLEEALVEAGRVRLRPILMTTATTVLGLLPMALGLGDGAEIRTPMAITVIAGLLTSTVLTLIVLPTIYAAAETAIGALRTRRLANGGRHAAPQSGGG